MLVRALCEQGGEFDVAEEKEQQQKVGHGLGEVGISMLYQQCPAARYAGGSGDNALRSMPLSKSRLECQRTSRITGDPVKIWWIACAAEG